MVWFVARVSWGLLVGNGKSVRVSEGSVVRKVGAQVGAVGRTVGAGGGDGVIACSCF